MSLRDKVKAYDKKYGTGNFVPLQDGQNQIRILTEPELYGDVYENEPVGSFIVYAIIRDAANGDNFAVLNLSKSVIRWLADQEDLGKFTGYPMPHDVMIFKQKTGKKSVYVSVAVSEADSPSITAEQMDILAKAKPIAELAQMLEKKKLASLRPAENLPAEVVEAHNQKALARGKAEVNPMFMAIERGINSAATPELLGKAKAMIQISFEGNSINEFEQGMLSDLAVSKYGELTGVKLEEDFKVEDIPF